jgi:hypothetical protein
MNGNDNGHLKWNINANTGISISIVVVLLGGFAWVIRGQNETKNELSMQALATKTELQSDIKDLKRRMDNYDSSKNGWNATAMFKWAVHLQQANPQIKVPEPEVDTK